MSDDEMTTRASETVKYVQSDSLLIDAERIIDSAKSVSRRAVNAALIQRNWLLGKRIHEEQLKGADRAEYGKQVISDLAKQLTNTYGRGFEPRTLYRFVQFYKAYPDILTTLLSKSAPQLTWSHYLVLLRVDSEQAREWYGREAAEQGWSVRTLDRNVSTPVTRCCTITTISLRPSTSSASRARMNCVRRLRTRSSCSGCSTEMGPSR